MNLHPSAETTEATYMNLPPQTQKPPVPSGDGRHADTRHINSSFGAGRNHARAAHGHHRVAVEHEDLSKGDTCPACGKGKLYHLEAGPFISISGSSPLSATEYQLERFRCSGCGTVFTAKLPEGVDSSKYTASADAMLALLRYVHPITA